ncbi:MAG: aminodeoxychorismate synthase component I [Verrucomicrobiota bacterium JB023]|nr:aminodeoxychorismate synthase component I [Verrucomicrobiota bacterium JB023]
MFAASALANQVCRPLSIKASPEEVFARLGHLAHPVFLDTAGHVPKAAGEVYSLLAGEPAMVRCGNLFDDWRGLDEAVRGTRELAGCRAPGPGWFGSVDYEGDYWFGHYPSVLIYHHGTGEWFEAGDEKLGARLRDGESQPLPSVGEWSSSVTRPQFEAMVARAQEYIAAGDIYQVNLSQRFSAPVAAGSLQDLYLKLRRTSPAPMAAYLDTGRRQILSSSPELFLKMNGEEIETRPIKGTRPRFADAAADIRSSHELRTSEKEMAELIMITDLLRNDLGKLAQVGSVRVEALAQLESLAQVHHLVSTVKADLRPEVEHVEALASCSPGGSITGAPKKRAREIIEELEPVPRGLYTGSIGYFSDYGQSQFNIAIRTLVQEEGMLHYHVGAGIVADSRPAAEYEETLHKARGMRLALA